MMKVLKYIIAVIALLFMGVLGISINNNVNKEQSYALKQNYSYLYKESSTMDVLIYSNIKSPRFSYINRNKYYLSDIKEDFLIAVAPISITSKKCDDLYLFDISIPVPNFNNIEVSNLMLKASNDYSEDSFLIGNLSIISDDYESDINVISVSKESDGNILSSITIELDTLVNVLDMKSPSFMNAQYFLSGKKITVSFDTYCYTYKMYLIIKTDKGTIKLDNITLGNSYISYIGAEEMLSVMRRNSFDD